ncbi:bifunctional 3'-5' exonuclease/DNA polymerase [Sediminivirga luteola]
MSANSDPPARWCVLGHTAARRVAAVMLNALGDTIDRIELDADALPEFVSAQESAVSPRWVWSDAPSWYPPLLAAGVRVDRCHDLRLCHAILCRAELVADRAALVEASHWDAAPGTAEPKAPGTSALFEIENAAGHMTAEVPHDVDEALREFGRQRAAVTASASSGRLQLLLAAESAGALAAVEMGTAGVPWDEEEHSRILTETLGPKPAPGQKPARMAELAHEVRRALNEHDTSLDSPPKLLRSLRRAGINVQSTSRWELEDQEHPVIEPLLQYKRLARLHSANGWAWLTEWVNDGRYHPVYVPGGVVTGRWASSGGGALQLPRVLRPALRADPGWLLVSADVAQLEPRVLAAMAGDTAMAAAGRGKDLYSGIVQRGIVATRQEAKIAVLGALYGSTTGDSGRLVPQLRRIFPAAMAVVDRAASTGERGGIVSTWLGRSSPPPGPEWHRAQDRASQPGAGDAEERRARSSARSFGRFTRNFVVQGTAAEWALAWIAELRLRLARMAPVLDTPPARASGPAFERRPHLVFFLHDEVIVHAPAEHAEEAAEAVRASAVSAGKLLFGDAPVDFPLDVRIAERAVKG